MTTQAQLDMIAEFESAKAVLLELKTAQAKNVNPEQWLIVANSLATGVEEINGKRKFAPTGYHGFQPFTLAKAKRLAAQLSTSENHTDARAMHVANYIEKCLADYDEQIEMIKSL